ncbi:hypothetical protein BH23CHL5_BH23CHL5_28400 [soil metagenome]
MPVRFISNDNRFRERLGSVVPWRVVILLILVGGSLLRMRSTRSRDYDFVIVSTHSVAAFAMLLFALQAWLTLRPRHGEGTVTAIERSLCLTLRLR